MSCRLIFFAGLAGTVAIVGAGASGAGVAGAHHICPIARVAPASSVALLLKRQRYRISPDRVRRVYYVRDCYIQGRVAMDR